MSSWQKEEPSRSDETKKKEDEWGWGAILGGIAVAGAIAVGAGMAYNAYSENQKKEQQKILPRAQGWYSSDEDSPLPARKAIPWIREVSEDTQGHKPMNKVQVLEHIHKNFVSIKGKKEEYVKYFMQVRKNLIPKMKEESPAFAMLTNGEAMSGEFPGGLQIVEPNVFEYQIYLHVPQFQHLDLVEDSPGSYKIKASRAWEMMRRNTSYQETAVFVKKWMDQHGYLQPEMIRRSVQSLLYKVLNNWSQFWSSDDFKIYNLNYHQDDPSHRIDVLVNGDFKFSFKITALIKFKNWISIKPNPWSGQTFWGAVGNPRIDVFHPSYDIYERKLIKNKLHLKMAIRLIKKLARRHEIPNFDNAFVKNICMSFLDNIDCTDDIYTVLDDILNLVNDSLKAREVDNYWHPENNLLDAYTYNQREAMISNFSKVYKMWKGASAEELKGLFLTWEEMQKW